MFVSTAFGQEQSSIVTMATKMLQFLCIPRVPNCMENLKGSWKFSFPKLFDSYRDSFLTAIVYNFRTFVGLFIFVIPYGSNHEMDIKRFQLFLLAKKTGTLALGMPILSRQYGGSKVIFWIQLKSQNLVISVKRSSLPLNIYFKKTWQMSGFNNMCSDVLRSI